MCGLVKGLGAVKMVMKGSEDDIMFGLNTRGAMIHVIGGFMLYIRVDES
jgi:hypothetical protein